MSARTALGSKKKTTEQRVAAALLGLLLGFPVSIAWAASPATPGTPKLILFSTGSVQGYLDKCGCPRAPLGGIDKRQGYMNSVRKRYPRTPQIILDAGNIFDNPGPGGDIKSRGLIEAMNRMGYQAAAVGERELMVGVDHFGQITQRANFPFLSANLIREKERTPWLIPGKVINAGSLKVAVLGLTRFNSALRLPLPGGDTLVTSAPLEAVQTYLPQFKTGADLVILLAALPLDEARILARRVPGIDIIIGAHGGRFTSDPIREGETTLFYLGDEGKYLGQFEIHDSSEGKLTWSARLVQMGDIVPSDPFMADWMVNVMSRAQDAEEEQLVRQAAPQANGRTYLGPGACAPCHAAIVTEWSTSAHSQAFKSLQESPKGFKPSCIPCHVTGPGQAGGFVDVRTTPHLLHVTCESCHGPGASHVQQPDLPYGKTSLTTCTQCHTSAWDPSFNYYQDRQLVNHSGK